MDLDTVQSEFFGIALVTVILIAALMVIRILWWLWQCTKSRGGGIGDDIPAAGSQESASSATGALDHQSKVLKKLQNIERMLKDLNGHGRAEGTAES